MALMVVVEDTVIYPFAGSTIFVNLSISPDASGHRRIESDILVRFCVDTVAIGEWGAFLPAVTGADLDSAI